MAPARFRRAVLSRQLRYHPGEEHEDWTLIPMPAADTPARGCYGCCVPPTVLTPAIRDEIARLGKADIMVGIPSFKNAATIGYVARAAQAGLVQYFPDLRPVLVNSDAGSPDGTQRVVIDTEPPDYVEQILLVRPTNRLDRVSLTYPEIEGTGGKGAALRTIFEMAAALDVEALVVVDSDLRSIVPEWIGSSPDRSSRAATTSSRRSTRYKFDGTITNTVTYPLTGPLRAPHPPADRWRLRGLGRPGPPLPRAR